MDDLLKSYRQTRRGLIQLRARATNIADREIIGNMIHECTQAIKLIKNSGNRPIGKTNEIVGKQSGTGYNVVIDSYKDLLTEIDQLEFLQNDLVKAIKKAGHVIWTGVLPSEPFPVHIGLDKAIARYRSLTERLEGVMLELKEKRTLRAQLDEKFQQLEGLDYIVAFKRRIEGKSLKVIAKETGYTEGWIKKVSMRVNREIRNQEGTHREAK